VKAGYSQNNKYSGASELMSNPKVQAYLKRARKARHSNFLLSYEDTLKHLSKLAAGKVKEEVIVTEGTGEGCSTAVIKKKRVDGRVQFAAIKEVLRLHEESDTNEIAGKGTDDRIHAAMRDRVVKGLTLQNEDAFTFEEDADMLKETDAAKGGTENDEY
jgi:phage terminase small subunit